MKHKGSVMEFHEERTLDLMRAYDEYLRSCDYICMPDVYASVVNMPSARFWVSGKRAYSVVLSIANGCADLDSMWPLHKEMYLEIYRRVLEEKEKYPKTSMLEICFNVVEQPAPKFYLAPGSAKVMICKARKDWVKKKRERIFAM